MMSLENTKNIKMMLAASSPLMNTSGRRWPIFPATSSWLPSFSYGKAEGVEYIKSDRRSISQIWPQRYEKIDKQIWSVRSFIHLRMFSSKKKIKGSGRKVLHSSHSTQDNPIGVQEEGWRIRGRGKEGVIKQAPPSGRHLGIVKKRMRRSE